jgi:RNA polymerase sigma factor (sigma-70 family)
MHAHPTDRSPLTSDHARIGVDDRVDRLFRRESARLIAALARIFGVEHLDLVEDVVQDALLEALRHWRYHGLPDNPRAWISRVARNRAVDQLRRRAVLKRKEQEIATRFQRSITAQDELDDGFELDEQLQLMFACCDPRLPRESRIALTLKSLCGFGVPEIARAFLASGESIAQRLVRAKRMIRESDLALAVPSDPDELAARLESVLQTLYLTFNEGYLTHRGDDLIRHDLVAEACRLTSMLLRDPRTARPEAHALLALMLFHAARINSRTAEDGSMILIDEQNRDAWDQSLIQRGYRHLQAAMTGDHVSAYHLEAGIAAVHARACTFEETDWPEILELYDLLFELKHTPVVALNRAVAVAMVRGCEAGLEALEDVRRDGRLSRYYLFHAVRGEILYRTGRHNEAAACFRCALDLECTEPERCLLRGKLEKAQAGSGLLARAALQ